MSDPSVELRQWEDSDLEPFAAMNADPEVMTYFIAPLTEEESSKALNILRRLIDEQGWGLWAVEVDGEFAGFTGLARPSFSAHFTPCVEIGWRFQRKFWGRSIAFAAARKAEAYATSWGSMNWFPSQPQPICDHGG